MSSGELQLFDDMSRFDQLKYLHIGKTAQDLANLHFPQSAFNGKGDAFRHALLHALETHYFNETFSKTMGDLHEVGSLSMMETTMDLYNNSIGRQIAKNYVSANPYESFTQQVMVIIQIAMDRGDLLYMTPLDNNNKEIIGVTELKATNQ